MPQPLFVPTARHSRQLCRDTCLLIGVSGLDGPLKGLSHKLTKPE
jgi:hypothetical protein